MEGKSNAEVEGHYYSQGNTVKRVKVGAQKAATNTTSPLNVYLCMWQLLKFYSLAVCIVISQLEQTASLKAIHLGITGLFYPSSRERTLTTDCQKHTVPFCTERLQIIRTHLTSDTWCPPRCNHFDVFSAYVIRQACGWRAMYTPSLSHSPLPVFIFQAHWNEDRLHQHASTDYSIHVPTSAPSPSDGRSSSPDHSLCQTMSCAVMLPFYEHINAVPRVEVSRLRDAGHHKTIRRLGNLAGCFLPWKICFILHVHDQEYIRDKSVQPRILACITTFF